MLEKIIGRCVQTIKNNKTAAIFFAGATLLDAATTIYIMNHYGIDKELWAPYRFMAETFGIETGVILGKTSLYVTTLYVSGIDIIKDKAKYVLYGLGVPTAIFGAWNLSQIVGNY